MLNLSFYYKYHILYIQYLFTKCHIKASVFFYHLHIILIKVLYHLHCFPRSYEDFSGVELTPTV